MEHRRVAHFEQLAVLPGRIDRQLVSGAIEGILGLQHAEGDLETLEVFLQVPVPLAELHRLGERLLVVGRQLHPLLLRQLEERAQAERAIQVAVQIGLRQRVEQLCRDGDVRRHPLGIYPIPRRAATFPP